MGTIGILVDAKVFRNIKNGKTGREKLGHYNKAASKHGLTLAYMCLERISLSTGKAHGYKVVNGKYVYKQFSIPKVIHNRTLPSSNSLHKRLKHLSQKYYVFNARNRFPKFRIHRLLKIRFASHLPVTTRYSRVHLRNMMNRFNSLYIKPQSGSIGKGIIKITRKGDERWKVQLPTTTVVTSRKRAELKVNNNVKRRSYLIQQTIPLATYKGNPYDIRVSIQRDLNGKWRLTGLYGKIARKGSHVTNVARGGTAKKCDLLFQSSFQNPSQVVDDVQRLSLDIARFLGNRLKHLADVGLDIGVNRSGKPFFIEMNGRDQRYGFIKAKMPKTFYRTYESPILYAKYVMQSGKK
ncbi:YheC/YheD family protein [Paenibacillus albiflavus]|uniref:YheC/YheD family protein n=1 Tax=Paenibacillus albiflavus TaxID=2545760 RepID=A0A4V2WPW4_9BACL|nr:YheC/YheD family protein [Paenibacillus albiflavus]TCZ80962.1 YheC/YheD family protein [Paenibacillus albiflavus]